MTSQGRISSEHWCSASRLASITREISHDPHSLCRHSEGEAGRVWWGERGLSFAGDGDVQRGYFHDSGDVQTQAQRFLAARGR